MQTERPPLAATLALAGLALPHLAQGSTPQPAFSTDLPYRGETVLASGQPWVYQSLQLFLPDITTHQPPHPVYVEVSPLRSGQDPLQSQWFAKPNFSDFALAAHDAGFAIVLGKVGRARETPGAECTSSPYLVPGNGTFVPFAIDVSVYQDPAHPTAERDTVMLIQNIRQRIADPNGNTRWKSLRDDQIVLSGHSIEGIVESWVALGPDRAAESWGQPFLGPQDAQPTDVAAFVSRRALLSLPSVKHYGTGGAHWPDMNGPSCPAGSTPMYPPGTYDRPTPNMASVDASLKDEASAHFYGSTSSTPTFLYYNVPNASTNFLSTLRTESDPHSAWSGLAWKFGHPDTAKLVVDLSAADLPNTGGLYDVTVTGNSGAASEMSDWLQQLFSVSGVHIVNLGGGDVLLGSVPHIWAYYDAPGSLSIDLTETAGGHTAHVQVDSSDIGVSVSTSSTMPLVLTPPPPIGSLLRMRIANVSGATVAYTNELRIDA